MGARVVVNSSVADIGLKRPYGSDPCGGQGGMNAKKRLRPATTSNTDDASQQMELESMLVRHNAFI